MIGKVTVINSNLAFVKVEDDFEKYYVDSKKSITVADLDIVKFYLNSNRDAVITEIIKRNSNEFVGKLEKNNSFAFVNTDKILKKDIYISKKYIRHHKNNDLVKVQIYDWGKVDKKPEAKIVKNYGNCNNAENIVSAKIEEQKIPHKFSKEILHEADTVSVKKCERSDLTKYMHVTIDGIDTKDMDDAVYLEKTNYGYYLIVSIADVSAYVKKGSLIDTEALNRSNSVYLYDRVIPMLPKKLTNDLCSLNPNEQKFTISVLIKYDNNANVIDSNIVKSKIISHYKLNYDGVNEILNKNIKTFEYSEMIFYMQELSEKLSKKAKKRGYIEFEIPEIKLEIDDNKKLKDIHLRNRDKAEVLIENFMIEANKQVANYMFYNDLSCIYRIHERPNLDEMKTLNEKLKEINYSVKNPENLIDKLQKIIELTRNTKLGYFIHKLILRSMKKAIYSKENKGHFGLALSNYLHFTSPIRRYADLVVHRILSLSLETYIGEFKRERIDKKLNSICKKISDNERVAQKLEYLSRDIKISEYMQDYIGDKFNAIVTSIFNDRIFVTLDNYVEVELIEAKCLTMGDKIKVKIIAVNIEKGKIYAKKVKKDDNSKE